MKKATIAAAIVIALLAGVASGYASTLTFGTTGGSASIAPFGGYAVGPGTVYQQVYNAALFGASPILITDITFFGADFGGNFDDGTYTFDLSTTSKAVNGLDTTTFSNNVGPDDAVFASLPLSGAVPSQLTISGGPFLYDPLGGNLLLQIVNSTPSFISQPGAMYEMAGTFGTDSSRAQNYGTAGLPSSGLVTQFTYGPSDAAPVPEPASLTLLGLGLAGMGAKRWRQRKA